VCVCVCVQVELLPVMTEEEHTKYAKSGKLPKAITKKGSEMFQTPVIKASCHPVWNTGMCVCVYMCVCSRYVCTSDRDVSIFAYKYMRSYRFSCLCV
jgi:hypothetical protein